MSLAGVTTLIVEVEYHGRARFGKACQPTRWEGPNARRKPGNRLSGCREVLVYQLAEVSISCQVEAPEDIDVVYTPLPQNKSKRRLILGAMKSPPVQEDGRCNGPRPACGASV